MRRCQPVLITPKPPASGTGPCLTRLEAVLAGIDDGLLVLDKDWRCTYINEVAGAFLKSTPEKLIGKVVWEALPQARDSRLHDEL